MKNFFNWSLMTELNPQTILRQVSQSLHGGTSLLSQKNYGMHVSGLLADQNGDTRNKSKGSKVRQMNFLLQYGSC